MKINKSFSKRLIYLIVHIPKLSALKNPGVFSIINNKDKLLSHGHSEGREVALDLIEFSIRAVDPYALTKKVRIEDMLVGDGSIYVVGGGKAAFPIAQALEEILDGRIMKGTIIVKRGEKRRLNHIKVIEAGHPIPDNIGLAGAKEIIDICDAAKEGDIVLCIITGGASALMPLPPKNISLEEKKEVTKQLLYCGATIDEINAVRKHISVIKGGRLAQHIHPAEIINLIIIDEIASRPWGPTVHDTTSFKDALMVLKKYRLWEKIPGSVRKHVERGLVEPSLETPKIKDFKNIKARNIILANNEVMCKAAKKRAEDLGFRSLILSTKLEGESREAGVFLANIAKEIEEKNRPVNRPCVLILGGETTVTISGKCGAGGPSQELVLGASLKISESKKIVIASVDTDGTDGPTNIAGGIVDGHTLQRAEDLGISIYENLIAHNSSEVLIKLQDAIITGPTGTNVMDLNIVVITR